MIPFSYLAFVEIDPSIPLAASTDNAVLNEWDLASANNGRYILGAYAPAIAGFRRSRLGGSGSFDDVLDQLTVHVVGATAAQCVANLESLLGALDQAARWNRLEPVNTIQIRAQVRQGAAGTVAAAVLGPPAGEPPAVLSPEWDEALGEYVIRDVVLRFGRRGAWVGLPPGQDVSGGGGAASQQIQTLTLPATAAPTPLLLALTADTTPEYPYLADGGRLLVGTAAADFTLIEAESLAVPNLVSTASNLARGGAYAALTGTGAQVSSAVATIPALTRGDVYLMMNNSSDVTVRVQLSELRTISYSLTGATTGLVTLTAAVPALGGASRSRPVYIGRVDSLTPLTRLWLQLTGPNTGAPVAQIDTIIIHRDAGIGTASLALAGVPYGTLTDRLNPLTVDAGGLTRPAPAVYQGQWSTPFDPYASVSYAGDAYLESVGATVAVLPLLCAPRETPIATNANGMFVPQTTIAGGTAVRYTVIARRGRAYRGPQ